MAKNSIKRSSNYIQFIAGLDTNATNRGEVFEAVKGAYGWMIYDSYTGGVYQCTLGTLRALIGEIRSQAHIDWETAETNFTREQASRLGISKWHFIRTATL